MADFAEDLKAYLQGLATTAGDQVYYDRAPQDASLPFVVITESQGGETVETLAGAAPLVEGVWHVYAFAASRPDANALAETIRKQLQRHNGQMGSTWVDNILAPDYRDTDVDNSIDSDYGPRYWTRIVYEVWHNVAPI